MKKVLVIAGYDPSMGAGTLVDTAVLAELGVFGAAAVTAVTAQNSRRFEDTSAIDSGQLAHQLDTLAADIEFDAVKIGMTGDPENTAVIGRFLSGFRGPVILDPVTNAAAGGALVSPATATLVAERLVPLALVVTPNIPEAEAMTGISITGADDMLSAAEHIRGLGPGWAFVTGGHLSGPQITDVLSGEGASRLIEHPRLRSGPVRGTGCMVSSALTGFVVLGYDVVDAAVSAVEYVTAKIRTARRVGSGSLQADFRKGRQA